MNINSLAFIGHSLYYTGNTITKWGHQKTEYWPHQLRATIWYHNVHCCWIYNTVNKLIQNIHKTIVSSPINRMLPLVGILQSSKCIPLAVTSCYIKWSNHRTWMEFPFTSARKDPHLKDPPDRPSRQLSQAANLVWSQLDLELSDVPRKLLWFQR